MLRIEATRWAKYSSLFAESFKATIGAASGFLGYLLASYHDFDDPAGAVGVLGALITFSGGAVALASAVRKIMDDWYYGGIHKRIIANSRTLAIVSGDGHPRFIKHWECVAAKEGGLVLVLPDGTEQSLSVAGVSRKRMDREFLEPFYDWWWPGTTPAVIQEYLVDHAPKYRQSVVLVAGVPFCIVVAGVLLGLRIGAGVIDAALVIAVVSMIGLVVHGIRQYRRAANMAYPLVGESAAAAESSPGE